MHIAIYHDALIPPPKYGGTERIVYWLAKALVSLGHSVTLIAEQGSQVPGVDFIPAPHEEGSNWEDLLPAKVDLVHLWSTPQKLLKKPFLVTIEGNGKIGEKFHPNTVFVSRKHAEIHGSESFVYNGIDPEDYFSDETRENYLVFLAKASWKVKNLKGAIQIAQKAGLPLYVMGSRDWPVQANRWLSWRGIHYLGMVGDREKRQILRKAKGLLFPVRWHEPFGIAITEALASGCPVFGTPYGSLPEIVTSQTGFLSDSSDEILKAILTKKFSPQDCRKRVYEKFTHIQMAEAYLHYYKEILNYGSLNRSNLSPSFKLQLPAQTLLPWKHWTGQAIRQTDQLNRTDEPTKPQIREQPL